LGITAPGWDAGFAINLSRPGYLYVDRKGHRFVDESRVEAHTACQLTANYGPPSFDHPRLPFFAVFDEEVFTSGPLGISMFSYNVVKLGYQWSQDNQTELDNGWILRAQTLNELAHSLGIPAGTLKRTVDTYNQDAQTGNDADFGRSPESLKPLTPPFLCVAAGPAALQHPRRPPPRQPCPGN
jgi:hypothetical protein